ncbi:MAG: hypothetical protein K1060chlam4_01659, partial [Candidatus Anoxychlamydiales bacterium]|nr:hypothetical protein [Candidatus Anoxychlamydiales bacterium]
KASDDLPEPDTPVNTINSKGSRIKSTLLRL